MWIDLILIVFVDSFSFSQVAFLGVIAYHLNVCLVLLLILLILILLLLIIITIIIIIIIIIVILS